MSYKAIKKVIDLGDGRTIEIETGKLAKQADGSVVVKMGDTMLLATVVSSLEAKEGVDFLPLSVDYQEKYAATGRIPGGFLRREARLSDYEVLISADKDIMPDCLAGLAASAALAVSDIPFNGPISEVRVAKVDGQLVINPTLSQLQNATLEFIVAGSEHDINMVEGESKEIQDAELVEAIDLAHQAITVQCLAQIELAEQVGKTVKRVYSHETSDEDLKKAIYAATYEKVYAIAASASAKDERTVKFKEVRDAYIETLGEID